VALLDRNLTDLSVGQRQMMAIAAGLATDPEILFCDDPVATLDPSAQAKVINYLDGLIQKGETTILFISQDLSMVRHLANRVAVMCLGIIVEMADKDDLFNDPLHPYTQALMSAIPIADPSIEERRQRIHLSGETPSPCNVPSGCRFRTCCPIAVDRCVEEIPEERLISHGHLVRCHLVG
jgi:oligopeptide transport system ATP-binding protein